ncbi:MAG TPA: RNA 2',3'-cyclic phosphodiesterase [Proteobacteria bacterium]|nr:RNA 2',3'-cyclic phosphodiesterase [Pseudomonadota bacterium]
MTIRAFIAIGLPGELQAEIGKISSALSARIPGVRWVPSENLHLTLKFLGDIEEAIIPDIQVILDQVTPRHLPINCKFGGLGVFPDLRSPKIIWIGVTKGRDLIAGLADDLSRELSGLGFKPEKRGFTPHLTLGRVKKGVRTAQLRKLIEAEEEKTARLNDSHGLLYINMLLLQKSILTSKGAIYHILSEHK